MPEGRIVKAAAFLTAGFTQARLGPVGGVYDGKSLWDANRGGKLGHIAAFFAFFRSTSRCE